MELVALLCRNTRTAEALLLSLRDYTVWPARDVAELEESLINYIYDVVIVDSGSVEMSATNEVIKLFGREAVILIEHNNLDRNKLEEVPYIVRADASFSELQSLMQMLLARKKSSSHYIRPPAANSSVVHRAESETASYARMNMPGGDFLHRHVLVNFAKILTANFDRDKLLSHFMDSLSDIAKVNRMSIMLREKNSFLIKASKGLDLYLAQRLKLDYRSALVHYLAQNGAIIQRTADQGDGEKEKIFQEMGRLQCSLSFPMMYKGKLEGIVNMGEKITGEPFCGDELEVIYTLCNYQSAAIKDFDQYHQIQSQKEFIRNTLDNMNSGVITIDRNDKVCVINPMASDILGIRPEDILGEDLRNLPSPIGDILYETMADGISYKRHEVQLRPKGIELGINSYPLADEIGNVSGAGIVFSDISNFKKYEEEKREAEKLKMMNVITGQIAHNIKNPLSSIMTFTQLIDEKFNDADFRQFYKTNVLNSVSRLNNLINKILFLSDSQEFKPETQDLNIIIREAVESARKEAREGVELTVRGTEKPVFVNADRKSLSMALYYMIISCAERLRQGRTINVITNINGNKVSRVEIEIMCSDAPIIESHVEEISLLNSDVLSQDMDVALMQKIVEAHKGGLSVKQGDSGNNSLLISLPVKENAGNHGGGA
jgi:PAS domain S-box-containing protein